MVCGKVLGQKLSRILAAMTQKSVFELVRADGSYTLEEQLEQLANVSEDFASSLDLEEALVIALNRFMDYLDADAASVFLIEDDAEELVCHRCAGPVNIEGLRISAGDGIVGKSIRSGECQMVRDVSLDPDFAVAVDQFTGYVTRSILCAPLMVKGQSIGAIELINKRSGDGLFDEKDRNLVKALASAAALAIHNARMAQALVEKERLERELELARQIQKNLLPVPPSDSFPVTGVNIPAWEVSGDFYDFLPLPDGRIYFNLADVSGKGMNAALLMAKTSSLLHCLAKSTDDASELMRLVNNEVCETASHGMFVTIVSGFIDPDMNRVTLANAGHQPPLLHTEDGEFIEFEAQAPPLGVIPDIEFPVHEFTLGKGALYCFTDGVTESVREDGQPVNVEGLIDLIRTSSTLSALKRLESIVAEVRSQSDPQHDDITLMLIEHRSD
jgi:sigma-B regulation protein RsbU (phosphoserine phosphatase)